jgi:phosphatidylserine/phosphatidylglycerophosphate/cardiolipin synthase-like enzyme
VSGRRPAQTRSAPSGAAAPTATRGLLATGLALTVLLALAVVPGAAAADPAADGTGTSANASSAAILAVYPNPVADRDAGEFVVVRFPAGGNYTLSDGETEVRIAVDARGTAVLSTEPAAARNATPRRPVRRLRGSLALSNAGERLRLRRGDRVVDRLEYADAPEGEVRRGGTWAPPGRTDLDPVRVSGAAVEAFALPDAPGPPIAALRDARERIYLAGYTLTSRRVVRALGAAARRGADVRVLVDGGPVGGITRREARRLDALVEAGVDVRVLDGPRAPYRFHHAKYAVADGRAVVTSENWKPGGTGGHGNRGWGVRASTPALTARLAGVFRADFAEGARWRRFRADRTFDRVDPPDADAYPTAFRPLEARADATLLVAPDNAERGVVALLDGADREIAVQQVGIERGSAFERALLRAAGRGVRVRVLLSGAWYVREENRRTARRLRRLARERDLPLTVRLAAPRSRYESVHVKGAIVDREAVLVGSLNWNNVSARENREVALVLRGDRVGGYYRRVFRADWRGGAWRLPIPAGGALLAGVIASAGYARRKIRFRNRNRNRNRTRHRNQRQNRTQTRTRNRGRGGRRGIEGGQGRRRRRSD